MEEKKNKSREELAKDITKKLDEIANMDKLSEMIKDNKIYFELDKKEYRVRKPTFKEKNQIERLRSLKKMELIKDQAFKFRRQWIDIYKEQGIDLDKLEKEIEEINLQIEDVKLKIGGTESIEAKKRLSEDIQDLKLKRNKLIIEQTDYLEYSIEDILTEFSNISLVVQVLEVKDNDKWIKVFKDYDDLMNSDNQKLVALATGYTRALIFQQLV